MGTVTRDTHQSYMECFGEESMFILTEMAANGCEDAQALLVEIGKLAIEEQAVMEAA